MITKTEYPKTYELLNKWIIGNLKAQRQSADIVNALPTEKVIDMVLNTQGRMLFDFYDEHNLQIGIWYGKLGWKYRVEGDIPIEGNAPTRKEAETKAFEEALNRLEKR